jgi:penicillin-binding protein 1C
MQKLPSFKNRLIGKIARKRAQLSTKSPKGWIGKILLGVLTLGIVGSLAGIIFIITVVSDIPDVPTRFNNAESTIIYDREGNILYTIHGEENRKEIPLSEIPKHVIDATVAIEDDQFFEHHGFDVGGILKGFLAEYIGLGQRRGGSTITQQLVKNTLLSNERTLTRKLKELIISIQLERTYSKNEILSLYLNTIPYGSNAYGIEMASRIFFDKNAKDLTLAEASILASLPQAPSRYNPYSNGKEALMGYFDEEGNYIAGRKDVVLKRMEDLGYVTSEERQKAFDEAAQISFNKKYKENIQHPHFVLYVKELLENKFGKEAVETGGIHVYTTIDPNLQKKAEEVIAEKMLTYPEKYGATNTAVLSVDIEKGQILAMVGSSDYFNEEIDGNVNVVFRKRQPGSSFKPVVYAAAFAKGYSPATVIYDLETDFGNDYIPQNYDGSFRGPITARRALNASLNIPAVKMAFLAGVDNVVNLAKKMGYTDLINGDQYGTSIGLGTGEVTLYQMVTAYSVFANGGKKMAFTPFLRIETSDGKIIENNEDVKPKEIEVLDPQIAYTINHVISDKTARPPGWNNNLQLADQINGAKTGTSNKRVKPGNEAGSIKPLDNWTLGYTTKIVTGVWVGNNDSSPLNFNADGLTTAAPIWKAVMTEATKNHDLEEFPKPDGISWKKVSKWTGLLPSELTPDTDVVAELFTTFNTPTEVDQSFMKVKIDKVSKKLPTEFTPQDSIVDALVANFHSLNPTDPNWEKPVQQWAKGFIESYGADTIVLEKAPTEFDDIHTADSEQKKPKITIITPQDNANLPAGTVDIFVEIDAPNGVEKVEYFVDKRLSRTTTTYPYSEKIRIPRKNPGDIIRVGVTVTDLYQYQGTDVISVTSSEIKDSVPPETQIISPEEGAIFPADTTITIETNSKDDISVDQVDFYLDDRLIGEVKRAPYNLSIALPDEIAPHTIVVIAKDNNGNTARDEVSIKIEDAERRTRTSFVYPKTNSIYKAKIQPIDFFIQIASVDLKDATQVRVLGYNKDLSSSTVIYDISTAENSSQNFSFSWTPTLGGDYEFLIETISEAETKTSTPLTLKIEE